jgi:hypothetical protein
MWTARQTVEYMVDKIFVKRAFYAVCPDNECSEVSWSRSSGPGFECSSTTANVARFVTAPKRLGRPTTSSSSAQPFPGGTRIVSIVDDR